MQPCRTDRQHQVQLCSLKCSAVQRVVATLSPACRDIYTPISNVLYHHYARQKGKSVFADHDNAQWWATVRNVSTQFCLCFC